MDRQERDARPAPFAVIAASADGYRNPLERAIISVLEFAGRLAGRRERYARYSRAK